MSTNLPKANLVFQVKYGYDEAVFLTPWVEALIEQMPEFSKIPYSFKPNADFNINQYRKENPSWNLPKIRKTLDNLKDKKVLDYRIHKPDLYFWLLDHESLIKEIQYV